MIVKKCLKLNFQTVRYELSALPGIETYQYQTQFLLDLSDPERQEEFRGAMESNSRSSRYPYDSNGLFVGSTLGGIKLMEDGSIFQKESSVVDKVGATRSLYCLNDSLPENEISDWVKNVTKLLNERFSKNENFDIFKYAFFL